jgi:CheY-like chemotaxis protein
MSHEPLQYPKILLIDDDRVVSEDLQREAAAMGAQVTWCRSLADLGSIGRIGDFDAVIADLSADPVNGLEIADYVGAFVPELPVLLLSDDGPAGAVMPILRWPPSVHAHVPKRRGVPEVLRVLFDVCVAADVDPVFSPMSEAFAPAMTA